MISTGTKKWPVYALVAGGLSMLFVIIFLLGKTSGQQSVLAASFVDDVAGQVKEDTYSAIANGITDKIIKESITEYLTQDTIDRIIEESIQGQGLSETEINEITRIVKETVSVISDTGADILTETQKREISGLVDAIVEERLSGIDINDLTDEEIELLRDRITQDLKNSINAYVSGMDISLTEENIMQIQQNLLKQINLKESIETVLKDNNYVAAETIEKIETEISTQIVEQIQTQQPVKGVDYFTAEEIRSIENNAASKAASTVENELDSIKASITSLKSSVTSVNTSVCSLQTQVQTLSAQSGTSVDTVAQNVTQITNNITELNRTAEDLSGKIDIRNSFLRRVTAKNGSIDQAEVVDTSNMTIAEFVAVLSGNEKEYTAAINQLYHLVAQIQDMLGGNYEQLSSECASLSANLDAATGTITQLQQLISAESAERAENYATLNNLISDNKTAVDEAFEAYQTAYEQYADDRSAEAQSALEAAEAALQAALEQYKTDLEGLSGTVDILGTSTQTNVEQINADIEAAQAALEAAQRMLDGETASALSESIATLSQSSDTAITELERRITAEENARAEAVAGLNETISQNRADVESKFEEYKEAYEAYANDRSEENAQRLNEAKAALEASITQYKNEMDTLSGVVDTLDAATQASVEQINADIEAAQAALEGSDDALQAAIDTLTASSAAAESALDNKIDDLTTSLGTTKTDLQSEITNKISQINTAMETLEEAQKAYAQDRADTAKAEAVDAAKTALNEAIGDLRSILEGKIETGDSAIDEKVAAANDLIDDIRMELDGDASTEGLKGKISTLADDLSALTDDIVGDIDDAQDIGGDTVMDKLVTLWNLFKSLAERLNKADTWTNNIILYNTPASAEDDGKIHYETSGSEIVWTLTNDATGLNFKEDSDITISYRSSTPCIIVRYEQGDGYLKIIVTEGYTELALEQNIVIESIHVESKPTN